MKRIITIAAVALIAIGCATTTQNGQQSGIGKILTPQRVQAICTLAAYAGARVDLQAHPERRPAYQAAQHGLAALIEQEEWNPDSAAVVLSDAAIGGFLGDEGSISIVGGMMLTDALGLGKFDAKRNDHAVALITGLESGLKRALTSPNASRSSAVTRGSTEVPHGTDELSVLRSAASATRTRPTI